MASTSKIVNHIEQLQEDAVVPYYKELYSRILSALRFNDLRAALCIAESGISGADEDRSWDSQVTSVINAIDGTLEHYGIPL